MLFVDLDTEERRKSKLVSQEHRKRNIIQSNKTF